MPGKNGREILAEIKEINPEIKVIFISGYTADIIQKRGIIEEGVEFVTKPFSNNLLLLKVREMLDRG
jgi:response regulator RpfG family c-di-GMP phosphodiesterase